MSRPTRWPVGLVTLITRAALLLYPPTFRAEFGADLVRDIREQAARCWREVGLGGYALWCLRTTVSLLFNAGATWLDLRSGTPRWSARVSPPGHGSAGRPRAHRALSPGRHLRVSIRRLLRGPTFTVVVVSTLGLAIGGTTAVFSVLHAVLLDPLPYPDSERLVRLYQYDEEDPGQNLSVTAPHFLEYRENAESFSALATIYTLEETGAILLAGESPERVRRLAVSSGYFEVLGQEPLRGRTFRAEDEVGRPVAVVSERLWTNLGGGSGSIDLGDDLRLDGESFTLVGIVPESLEDPIVGRVDVWVPQDLQGGGAQYPGNHFLSVIGRLALGVSPVRARREMEGLDGALAELYPDVADDGAFRLVGLHEDRVGSARPILLLLLGATVFVLLIACVNVANLNLVRALARTRNVALKFAMGASRLQVAGEALIESLVLAVAGGLAGVVVAAVGLDVLLPIVAEAIPRAGTVSLDLPVLLFAAGITLLTGVLFGAVPAVRLSRVSPAPVLRSGSTGDTSGSRSTPSRAALVSLQVALALFLVAGTSVLALSAHRLAQADLGMETERVMTFSLDLPAAEYDGPARAAFHRDLTRRLSILSGVEEAAATTWEPLDGQGYVWGTRPLTGPRAGDDEALVDADQRVVEGSYFEALGIPVLEGRAFDSRDGPDQPGVVIVSESLARKLFPETPAVGQRIQMTGRQRTIIGVVGDVAVDAEGRRTPHVYHPHGQFSERAWSMTYLARTTGEPEVAMPSIRQAVTRMDSRLVPYEPVSLAQRVRNGRARRHVALTLIGVFGGLALTLAALGLYGVLAHFVRERKSEIGVRMALGAGTGHVVGIVLRRTSVMVGGGLVLGLLGALALGRVLGALLYETRSTEPIVLASSSGILLLAAAAASVVPVLRASTVSPQRVLAGE